MSRQAAGGSPATAVERAGALLRDAIGLRLDETARRRLVSALRGAARDRGEPMDVYAARLAADRDERQRVIDAVTVPETAFFRDPKHFGILTRHVLPRLGPEGVVWCAGCAHGPEAWSLAMALEEGGFGGWTVLATDVAHGALERTAAGRYADGELKGLSAARRARFLRPARGGGWEVATRLRARVRTRAHNIAAEPPPLEAGECPVIFCRNVLIYLDRGAQERALAALAERMPPTGRLFLGAAEAIPSLADHFSAERFDGAFAYRPRRRPTAATAAGSTGGPSARRRAAAGAGSGERAPARGRGADQRPAADRAPARRAAGPGRSAAGRPGDAGAPTADGERLAAAGRHDEAVAAFREAAAHAPSDPLAHVRLGLALERAGRATAALAAFRAARAALARAGPEPVAPALEGWSVAELERLLAARLGP
jgi:chemotaxis methyl-accepting protein methylase